MYVSPLHHHHRPTTERRTIKKNFRGGFLNFIKQNYTERRKTERKKENVSPLHNRPTTERTWWKTPRMAWRGKPASGRTTTGSRHILGDSQTYSSYLSRGSKPKACLNLSTCFWVSTVGMNTRHYLLPEVLLHRFPAHKRVFF